MSISLLAGCQEQPAYVPTGNGLHQSVTTQPTRPPVSTEQTLSFAYYPDHSLNPYTATEIINRALFSLIYQPLFAIDRDYTVHPILCKSYSVSRDQRVYTFYLEAATFSDGSPLTAADVAASLLAAKASTVYQGRLTQMTDARATEDGGVEVTMGIPYDNLPLLLDIPIVKAEQTQEPRPLGTGPYTMEQTLTGPQLLRRESWWCQATLPVTARNIPLLEVDSPATARDDFEFCNIDTVIADPGSDTYVDYRCDYELWDCENGIFLYLACNKKSKVFGNQTLRAALTHAIDRDLLVSSYYRDFAVSATLPASPDSPFYDKLLAAQYGYDPEQFRQTLTQAQPETTAVTLLVNKDDSRRVRVARAIAQMLTDSGLTVTLSIKNGTNYTKDLKNGNYDLHLGQTKLSANMDLSAFFYSKGALNYGGLADTDTYSMCQNALADIGNYYTLHQMVMEEGMLCPILFRSYAVYARRGLYTDLTPARDNLFFYSLGKNLEQIKTQL